MPLALTNPTPLATFSKALVMDAMARHQLVWLTDAVWVQIQTCEWDAQAQEVLAHWRGQSLPVVLTRQRDDALQGQVCVGLPAPLRWSKRKLALKIPARGIRATSMGPTLAQIALENAWSEAALILDAALLQCGVQAYVYGSHAWQHETGLNYLHADSDLDLRMDVKHLDQAKQAVDVQSQAQLPLRLDGEIVFPGGQAVAWRELQQLFNGRIAQVLSKDFRSVRLVTMTDLRIVCGEGPP